MKIRRILIPATDFEDNHTVYYLEVYIREYSWIVTRRYKEFYELHDKLVKKHGIEYSLLPPKKYFGSLKPEYVERRRQALESYLEMLLSRFEDLPGEILEFLQASRYDVCGVTHDLANQLFVTGDRILAKEEQFTVTPLQLHCITSRLGMAVPTCANQYIRFAMEVELTELSEMGLSWGEAQAVAKHKTLLRPHAPLGAIRIDDDDDGSDSHSAHGEIGNLYDFIYQLKHLKVSGSEKQVELGDNITLKCNLSIFKSLRTIEISCCDIEPFEGLNFVQNHVNKLVVNHSIHLLKDILVDDEIWEQGVLENVDENGVASFSLNTNFRAWNLLTEADFSKNDIPYIDDSVALLPNITSLNLSHNCIESIDHLQTLSNLVDLDLSHNAISNLGSSLNTKLGNVKRLNLARNHFENVEGLDRLYSLVTLDLSENRLTDVGSVITLGELPCLEILDLQGNGLVKAPMYRVRIFTAFEDRAEQLQLDGQRPSTREMNRIQELLEEEENFEIINYPTPPHHTNKQGHKKGKIIDRLITLDPGDNIQSSVSSEDSSSAVDDTDAEFRSRVEQIRQLGGDSWLRILDEIQGEEEMLHVPVNQEPPGSPSKIESTRDHLSSTKDTVSEGDTSLTSQEEEARTHRANSEIDTVNKETVVSVGENESDPCRLQFGFAPDLEEILREKMESNAEVTSGTYMVEVEGEDHYEPGAEERMVAVDLCKGVLFEVQITTGRTCAKHNLEDISSVDILKLGGAFCVDIRDVYTKEWRRHRSVFSDSAVSSLTKDYRQVARYRMRSMEDAAELFALLYNFITERSTKEIMPRVVMDESSPGIFSGNTVEWKNPLGIQQDIIDQFFETFLLEPAGNVPLADTSPDELKSSSSDRSPTRNVQTVFQTLHDEFVDVGCLTHDRSGPSAEMVRLVLWSGCLPYVCPDRELPVCLLMTNVNIYLFYSSHFDSSGNPLKTANDLRQVLHCFYSFCVRELNEVVFGLFDQKFRMEVKQDGPRGTFTILTRDAEKTDKFLGTLRDVLSEPPSQGDSILGPRISRQFSSGYLPALTFPDEEKINKLKDELAKSEKIVSPNDGQHLLMYSIVREVSDWAALNVQENGDLTNMLRSLIVTDSVIFLCDEDHVHWPLPSFVRSPPSTPQWVITKSKQISRIIGIHVFELGGIVCELFGVFGLSLIFEQEELDATSPDHQHSWHLIFRAADERTQLQRSLSQVWKDHFQADLKITSSKPKSFQGPYNSHGLSSGNESLSPTLGQSPVSIPQNAKLKKTHRRVGSDSLPIFKPTMLNSLESLVALDRKVLDAFFHKWISQNDGVKDETLLHVLWTGCTPYLRPSLEIKVCVLLSNLFVYILADKEHKTSINKKKGIKLMNSNGSKTSKPAICFNFIPIGNLRQVCVGLFDQTLRLETESQEDTFTFITRDFNLTSAFLERLNAILSSEHPDALPDTSSEALPESIYDSSSISNTDPHPKVEYQHTQSGVRFVYPNDETLEFLKDAISESSVQSCDSGSRPQNVTILVYLLVFHETEPGKEEPRTLVIMDTSLCLCIEDHVNYPLPLFATGLPNNPQYQVQDLRDIESLSRVEFSDFNSCDFSMVFAPTRFRDEDVPEGFDSASMGELCVITHRETDPDDKDVCWRIVAQTYEEKEKALGLICKLWADIHGGALPVMKAKN